MDEIRLSLRRFLMVGLAIVAAATGCSTNNSKPGGLGGAANPGGGGAGGATPDAGTDTPATTDAIPDVPATTPVKLVFGPPALMMTEGQAMPGVLTISLDREWSTDITVTISSSNPNVATVVEGTVTFPAMTMGQKEIHVLAPVDDDTVDDTTTIVASAPETGAQIVTVSVTDPDIQSLLAFPPTVSMTEGRTESLSLRLAKKPTSAVVVTLASSNLTKLTLDTTSLTFDPTNYSIPVPITLTAVKDDDAISEHVSIGITATGKIQSLSVPVDITDIDAVNMDITPSSIALVERANMPGTIMVSLTKAPPNDVNVTVMPSDMTKISVSSSLLAFTPANYAIPQLVQVSAIPDNDGADESEKVTFTLTGITPAPDAHDVAVTVKDMDSQMITASPGAVTLGEGTTSSFGVQLTLVPSGDTTVNVFPQNPDKIQVLPPVLHFNASNYNMAQTVAIQALQDDDLADDDVNITLIASSGATATVTAHVMDDDHQAIVLVPAGGGTSLTMQEGANSALGVRLAFRPAAPATVNLVASTLGGGPSKLSVSSAQVPFSPADYAMPKFVTLTAAHLPDLADVMASLTASLAGSPDVTLPVKILDIDIQNLLITPDSVSVSEGGGVAGPAASFTVSLTQQPPAPVTPVFTLSPNLAGSASSSAKATIDASACQSLSGAAAMAGCKVMVKALPDADTRNESGTVTITATTTDVDGHTLTFTRTVAVTVTDSDTQALNILVGGAKVDPTAAVIPPISEGGMGKFTVALKADPVDQVAVSVFSNDPAHFSVSPSTLAFNTGNYAAGIEVTVTSIDDNDMASYTSTITVQGAAAGAATTGSVAVSEVNADVQAINISPGPMFSMLEGGTAQIGVRLTYRPVAGEVVTLTSLNPELLKFGTSPTATVTFDNSSSYSTNQFVTLTSSKDSNMVNDIATVTATSSVMTTPPPPNEIVTITDVDVLNFTVLPSTAPLTITEANDTPVATDSSTDVVLTVGLTVAPANPVPVAVSSTLPTASLTATFDPGASVDGTGHCSLNSLTSTCQLRLHAKKDLNALNEMGSITISGGAAIAASPTITVSTRDIDTQGLAVTGLVAGTPAMATTTIHESLAGMNQATFTVALQTQPASDVTVNVSAIPDVADGIAVSSNGSGPSPGSGSPLILTFTTANYNVPQTVTLTGVPDNDLKTDPFSIRVSAPGLGVVDQFVSVSEIDDNTQKIIVSLPTSAGHCPAVGSDTGMSIGSLTEGGAALEFCVNLQYQPLSNTVVDVVASPATLILGPTPPQNVAHLSFSTQSCTDTIGCYNHPQLVSFTAPVDNNAVGAAGQVNLSSSGFAATRLITFDVVDPKMQQFIFTLNNTPLTSGLSVTNNSRTVIRLRLKYDPVTAVTGSCGVDDGSPLSLSTGNFTLTGGDSGNWQTGQTITVSADSSKTPPWTANIQCTSTSVTNDGILVVTGS